MSDWKTRIKSAKLIYQMRNEENLAAKVTLLIQNIVEPTFKEASELLNQEGIEHLFKCKYDNDKPYAEFSVGKNDIFIGIEHSENNILRFTVIKKYIFRDKPRSDELGLSINEIIDHPEIIGNHIAKIVEDYFLGLKNISNLK